MTTFACHMAGKENLTTCAGFLLVNADNNLQVRLSMLTGRYDPSTVTGDGIELHESYKAMAVANGVPEDDPILALCRADNEY